MLTREEIEPCPFHGCRDVAVIKSKGFVFMRALKCGAEGFHYSTKYIGEARARETALAHWNSRYCVQQKRNAAMEPVAYQQISNDNGLSQRYCTGT